jgi:hypothetical protein
MAQTAIIERDTAADERLTAMQMLSEEIKLWVTRCRQLVGVLQVVEMERDNFKAGEGHAKELGTGFKVKLEGTGIEASMSEEQARAPLSLDNAHLQFPTNEPDEHLQYGLLESADVTDLDDEFEKSLAGQHDLQAKLDAANTQRDASNFTGPRSEARSHAFRPKDTEPQEKSAKERRVQKDRKRPRATDGQMKACGFGLVTTPSSTTKTSFRSVNILTKSSLSSLSRPDNQNNCCKDCVSSGADCLYERFYAPSPDLVGIACQRCRDRKKKCSMKGSRITIPFVDNSIGQLATGLPESHAATHAQGEPKGGSGISTEADTWKDSLLPMQQRDKTYELSGSAPPCHDKTQPAVQTVYAVEIPAPQRSSTSNDSTLAVDEGRDDTEAFLRFQYNANEDPIDRDYEFCQLLKPVSLLSLALVLDIAYGS